VFVLIKYSISPIDIDIVVQYLYLLKCFKFIDLPIRGLAIEYL
jgi:hypothetical protein